MDIHTLAPHALLPALLVLGSFIGYLFFIRPALRKNPAFKRLYDSEDTALNALGLKMSGLKQKITTVVMSIGGVVVLAHDSIAPLITQAGVDPVQILPKVPTWAWPVLTVAVLWLVQYFRGQADTAARANAAALLNVGQPLAAPAPGLADPALLAAPLPDKLDDV
jgi:hypothetical protein